MNAETDGTRLNVAAWEERSIVNGPGERFVLWLQGCPFRCPGCFNQDFLPFREANRLTPAEVASRILAVRGIEGVTFSGGEPMAQARGLFHLSRQLRAAGLTVVSYSGYTLEELRRSPWIGRFLDCIDVLIDGRYDATQPTSLPWRGSANQKVHFLTETYRDWEARASQAGRQVELVISKEGFVSTGIFDPMFIQKLEEALR